MIPITYGYARVSKADDDSKNLETQLRELDAHGIRRDLNQYQGGMCILGALTRTERTLRYLISPLGPTGRHRQCGLAICTFHLGFSLVQAVKDSREALPADPVAMKWVMPEWSNTGVVDGQGTEPAMRENFRDGRAQSAKGGDVVERADEQRPDYHFRVDSRSAEVGTVPLLQGRHQLGKVQPLINLDSKWLGLMKSRRLLVVNWNLVESPRQRS